MKKLKSKNLHDQNFCFNNKEKKTTCIKQKFTELYVIHSVLLSFFHLFGKPYDTIFQKFPHSVGKILIKTHLYIIF